MEKLKDTKTQKNFIVPINMQRCETCKHSMNYNKTCARYSGKCSCGMYFPVGYKINN